MAAFARPGLNAKPRTGVKILHVFNRYLELGGEEIAVDQMDRRLRERHEVESLFFDSRDWTGPAAPNRFIQARRTWYNRHSAGRFRESCERFQPDVALFHNVFPVGSPSLYHEARRLKLPIVHYAHCYRPFSVGSRFWARGREYPESLRGNPWPEAWAGAWQQSVPKSLFMAAILTRLRRNGWLDAVRQWVCNSEYVARRFVAEVGLPPGRVSALRYFWEVPALPAVLADDGGYLFLGRLVEEKGLGTLVEAWQRLGPDAPKLTIAGAGPLQDWVAARATESAGRIDYVGQVRGEAKAALIAGARALLVPSTWNEPLGLVPYEAFSAGKPVIASAAGGLTETVRDPEHGLLVPPGDALALANAVRRMEALAPTQREGMGRAGHRWLAADASPERWLKRFEKILERAVV